MAVAGADIVAKNIKSFGGGFRAHVKRVMTFAGELLDSEITANMVLRCHSQDDLNKLDHPYAVRHGSEGMPIHNPYWVIHRQSGRLLSSKKKGVSELGIVDGNLSISAWVGLDENIAPYAVHIIWGTSRMIPRDVLSGSLNDFEFKLKVREFLKRNLRDMVINFQGVETGKW